MSHTVIKVENLSKLYRLGEVGTGTVSHDLNRWWASVRGKEDPFAKVGQVNDRTKEAGKGEHVWAIKDINFEVKRGEVLGIIGKNGAGKSTLLKLLSRITSPTTGRIKLRGRVASLLEVGTGFHPEMTGKENVYLNGTILGMRRSEIGKKFEEIMDFAGCLRYIDTPVKRYSSGMKVRLGFAVAAFLDPDILIVDEVLAVGDAEFQRKAIGKMQVISTDSERTVLFVSHNMASVIALCNKCILLSKGQVDAIGDAPDMIDRYVKSSVENEPRNNGLLEVGRVGSGVIRIKRIQFRQDPHGEYMSQVVLKAGYPLHIALDLEIEDPQEIRGFNFAIQFYDKYERILFVLSTKHKGFKNDLILHEAKICVKIDSLNLVPDEYILGLWCEANNETSDKIHPAVRIRVEDANYWGTGRAYDSRYGSFLIDHEWEVLR